jgi:hypothetical protein
MDAPNIPPPYSEEDEEEEDEAEVRTQEMLGAGMEQIPAGPLPDRDEGIPVRRPPGKPPEEVGGVTRKQATEEIVKIQNKIDEKSKAGLYSVDAETLFESCKMAFSTNDYPAVMQLVKQITSALEQAEKDNIELRKAEEPETAFSRMYGPATREQAVKALQDAKDLILEAEKLGFDLTESKKIYLQAQPAFRANDFGTAINFAHDVEGSVNAVLGGKRLAKAPVVKPRYEPKAGEDAGIYGDDKGEVSVPFYKNEFFLKFLLPLLGLVILASGATLAFISFHDGIWNPFSDGPYDWGPYNTAGALLGIIGVIIGLLFAILPFILTKKIYVRMEPPKPVQMK